MNIRKLNPKTTFEEAYPLITKNFIPLYEILDDNIIELDLICEKKFKKGKDHVIFENIAVLYRGQKMLFEMCEEHSKFIYGIRDIVAEYGHAIEELSENVKELATTSTDKRLANKILGSVVDVQKNMKKIEQKADDVRKDVEDFNKIFDNIAEKLSKDKGDDKDRRN